MGTWIPHGCNNFYSSFVRVDSAHANDILTELGAVMNGKLRLFPLYVDFAAAGRAGDTTCQITQLTGEQWQSSAEMWSLSSLAPSDSITRMITRDAMDADVLIISLGSLTRCEPELVRRLNSPNIGKGNRTVVGLLIGLFGDGAPPVEKWEWTVTQLKNCAQRMERDFIWRWMKHDVMNDTDWRADQIVKLLGRKLSEYAVQSALSTTDHY
jgi:hypothetical protein